MRARLDALRRDVAVFAVSRYGAELTAVITHTIERWDGKEAARKIELHVGRDLQFIRINGTIVGGLVGVLIHTVLEAMVVSIGAPASEPPRRPMPIRDESIRLGQFLKLANLVDTGADAKPLLADGLVRVNGEVETRRGELVRRRRDARAGIARVADARGRRRGRVASHAVEPTRRSSRPLAHGVEPSLSAGGPQERTARPARTRRLGPARMHGSTGQNARSADGERSTTKISVSPGLMTPPAPRSPYPRCGGMTSWRRPPTFMPWTPVSQPEMTWPTPRRNCSGSPRLYDASNSSPVEWATPT